MNGFDHVRAEVLSPDEIDEAMAASPIVYLPFGALEYHGPHLPIGLDGLNATAVCVQAAARTGGIVLPTFYYGTGGTHTAYPWTIMLPDPQALVLVLEQVLRRLSQLGAQVAVLFSGHFAPEQLHTLRATAAEWNQQGSSLLVIVSSVEMQLDGQPEPDHAGPFETMLLNASQPALVHLDRLPERGDDDPDDGHDPFGPQRHDATHPLHGVIGPDPRSLDRARSLPLLDAVVSALVDQVEAAPPR